MMRIRWPWRGGGDDQRTMTEATPKTCVEAHVKLWITISEKNRSSWERERDALVFLIWLTKITTSAFKLSTTWRESSQPTWYWRTSCEPVMRSKINHDKRMTNGLPCLNSQLHRSGNNRSYHLQKNRFQQTNLDGCKCNWLPDTKT